MLGLHFDALRTSLAGVSRGLPLPPAGELAPWEQVGAPASRKSATTTNNKALFFVLTVKSSFPACPPRSLFAGGCRGGQREQPRSTASAIAACTPVLSVPPPKGAGAGRSIPRRWGLPGGKPLILHRCAGETASSDPAAFPCSAPGSAGGLAPAQPTMLPDPSR